ncbi:MAG: GGDEF domain-containing protein [Spirochaetales bacterium]|nr:GGDEF domain-containing protein [Spirochaetales bacterium]
MDKSGTFLKKLRETYDHLELKDQLYVIFFSVSACLSVIGFLLGILFQVSFLMNLPHLIIILMCLFLPVILRKSIRNTTYVIILFGSLFYIPFVFLTNNGYEGAAPIYMVMIIVFYAFHLKGKKLLYVVAFFIVYYISIIIWTFCHPEVIVPYHDEISHLIDLSVAVASVSAVLVFVSYSAFNGYKKERQVVTGLMEELKIRNKALEELSIRDQLTNTFSREYFLTKLKEELAEAQKDSSSFYVLMADIDYFKSVNDSYGHLFGDEVLRRVAETMKKNIRSFDIVARYGGEEFIMILTHPDRANGREAAERIRKSVESLSFRNNIKITLSIGLSLNCANDGVNDIIERADKELYKAKNGGRNQVCEWRASSEPI